MFVFSSSQITLFGMVMTCYSAIACVGTLLAMAVVMLYCLRRGLPVRPYTYTAGLVFAAATVLRLYQDGIAAAVLPYMVPMSTAAIAVFAYGADRALGVERLHTVFAFAMPAYLGVSKIGCFVSGCCIGAPYDGPFSVRYGTGMLCAVKNVPLFPAQLAAAMLLFAAGACAYLVLSRRRGGCVHLAMYGLTPLAYYTGAILCSGADGIAVYGDRAARMAAAMLLWTLLWMTCGMKKKGTGRI